MAISLIILKITSNKKNCKKFNQFKQCKQITIFQNQTYFKVLFNFLWEVTIVMEAAA